MDNRIVEMLAKVQADNAVQQTKTLGGGLGALLLGSGVVDQETADAMGELYRRKLAAALRAQQDGDYPTAAVAQHIVRAAEAEYLSWGGDPTTVKPDWVTALVTDGDHGPFWGYHQVPADKATRENKKWLASYCDVAEYLI